MRGKTASDDLGVRPAARSALTVPERAKAQKQVVMLKISPAAFLH